MRTCETCNGEGWYWDIDDPEIARPCYECKGKGTIKEEEPSEFAKIAERIIEEYKDGLDYLRDR